MERKLSRVDRLGGEESVEPKMAGNQMGRRTVSPRQKRRGKVGKISEVTRRLKKKEGNMVS